MGEIKQKIRTNLWFDGQAEEAAEFYCGVFPDSRIVTKQHYTEVGPGEPGTVVTVEFELAGQRFVGINGGPMFTFTEAISLEIVCADQQEVEHYWNRLGEGGSYVQCGWLKDRYGLSWQVVPQRLNELLATGDEATTDRVMKAMLDMVKLDIAQLEEAARG
ncbi:VOC family protein [Saccharopolyspora halophila]|uniref:VOC family protein n=1 Tax=Saccharopolyspora halophila TaxID=405551 RepID=A0ABN3G8R3_9PSEU